MSDFMQTLMPVLLLLAIAVVLLGVKVFFVKGGKFPSGHVHDSAALRERGISCVSHGHGHPTSSVKTHPKNLK